MFEIENIFEALKEEALIAVEAIMVQSGVKKDSDLIKSLDLVYKNNAFILVANDYYLYVSEGRRPRARKVPIKALIPWIKKNRIKGRNKKTGRFITTNQLAFAIQNSIYKNGIKGKNYIDKVDNVLLDILSEGTAEILSEVVAEAMFQSITNTN